MLQCILQQTEYNPLDLVTCFRRHFLILNKITVALNEYTSWNFPRTRKQNLTSVTKYYKLILSFFIFPELTIS